MKLEEAVQKAELLMRRGCRGELGLVLDTLIRHAEATRWRNLSEEKPTKDGSIEVAMWDMQYKEWSVFTSIWNSRSGGLLIYKDASHWRTIAGPEEKS